MSYSAGGGHHAHLHAHVHAVVNDELLIRLRLLICLAVKLLDQRRLITTKITTIIACDGGGYSALEAAFTSRAF